MRPFSNCSPTLRIDSSLRRRPRQNWTSVGGAPQLSLLSAAGVAWRLRNANGSIDVPASVPCVAHEALLSAGVLRGDPLYRFRELEWAWAAREDWTFEASFALAADGCGPSQGERVDCKLLDGRSVLRMEGVDTVASVWINGVGLGSTASAFVRHELSINARVLRRGSNTLRVTLGSALRYARERSEAYPYEVPHTQYYHVWSEPSHRNFVRKPASDFGWDWGPSFVPTGLTGAMSLRAPQESTAELEGVAMRQEHHLDGSVSIYVRGWLAADTSSDGDNGAASAAASPPSSLSLRVVLCFPQCDPSATSLEGGTRFERWYGEGVLIASPYAGADLSAHTSAESPSIVLRTPQLWWPRGYGSPALYELQAAVCVQCAPLDAAADAGESFTRAATLGSLVRRTVGMRTVELVTTPDTPPKVGLPNGTSFFFRVNGVDVFAKGANVIPAHIFSTTEWRSSSRWEWLLQQAAHANMNMVRVWGGGRYQPDAFYEAASRLGLMVWQEMIFACALYPRDAAFLRSVDREVREQVSRLATHPSIVIWGGNNENEAALSWYEPSREARDLYLADYVKLYVDTVMPAIRAADYETSRPAVDTSPSNGLISGPDPYVKRWGITSTKRHASAGAWGDVHYYNYAADCEDASTYPLARFVSEHGFQSLPAFDVYKDVTVRHSRPNPPRPLAPPPTEPIRRRHVLCGTGSGGLVSRVALLCFPHAPSGRQRSATCNDWTALPRASRQLHALRRRPLGGRTVRAATTI